MSKSTVMVQFISSLFYFAVTIISSNYYYGNDNNSDDNYDGGSNHNQEEYKEDYRENRILTREGVGCDSSDINYIPIILLLLCCVADLLYVIICIGFCFPESGEYKKM